MAPPTRLVSLRGDAAAVTEVRGSYVPLTNIFPFQSYFDTTLLQNALLAQDPASGIVTSSIQTGTIPGCYSFALHPDSETPIAIEVGGIDGIGKAATIFLKPGQIVSPLGSYRPFNTFKWGLPFGWLGGGLAHLLVFTSPDAYVYWGPGGEVIYHRMRVPILQPADLTAGGGHNNAVKNWPQRFPWVNAQQGSKQFPQSGQPVASIVRPTRAMMTLNAGTGTLPLAAPALMRILMQGSTAFGLDSAGAVVLGSVIFEDVNWPSWTNIGTSGNLSVQAPVLETQFVQRLGADLAGIACVDNSGTQALLNLFVDFVRMGRL